MRAVSKLHQSDNRSHTTKDNTGCIGNCNGPITALLKQSIGDPNTTVDTGHGRLQPILLCSGSGVQIITDRVDVKHLHKYCSDGANDTHHAFELCFVHLLYILSDCFGAATTSGAVACFVYIAANLGETCEKIKSTTPKNENQHKIPPLCLLCIGTSTPFFPRFLRRNPPPPHGRAPISIPQNGGCRVRR